MLQNERFLKLDQERMMQEARCRRRKRRKQLSLRNRDNVDLGCEAEMLI